MTNQTFRVLAIIHHATYICNCRLSTLRSLPQTKYQILRAQQPTTYFNTIILHNINMGYDITIIWDYNICKYHIETHMKVHCSWQSYKINTKKSIYEKIYDEVFRLASQMGGRYKKLCTIFLKLIY